MSYNFSDSIQRGILYYFKAKDNFHVETLSLIDKDYFEFPAHSKIFSIIKDFRERYGKLPKDDVIIEQLKNNITQREKLSDYTLELEFINNINPDDYDEDYMMDLVEAFAKKQKMKAAFSQGIPLINEGKMDDVYALVHDALLVSRNVNVGQDYFGNVDARIRRVNDRSATPKFKGVLPTIDNTLDGGLERKELALIVAPAGVGKSLYLANQAVTSVKENKNTLFISLEMSEDKVAQRIDSIASNLSQNIIKSDRLRLRNEITNLKANNDMGTLFIKEFLGARENINSIRAYLNKIKSYLGFVPDVIIVDYLELLLPSRDCVPHKEQEIICRDLRTLAQEYNCMVVTATQTNREGKKVNIITDTELADCYGKIRPCDLVISLNQNTEEYDKGLMRAYVIKARDARKGYIVGMDVNYNTLVMKEPKNNGQRNI